MSGNERKNYMIAVSARDKIREILEKYFLKDLPFSKNDNEELNMCLEIFFDWKRDCKEKKRKCMLNECPFSVLLGWVREFYDFEDLCSFLLKNRNPLNEVQHCSEKKHRSF